MIPLRLALATVLISFSAMQCVQADGITNGRFETGRLVSDGQREAAGPGALHS